MKLSVVVPVWNPGPNLERCMRSLLLEQTMPVADYEVVLVDDGSTDGTGARLDDLAREYGDRLRVIHIPASGWPGKPRNVGIDAARGEYVHLVDNDDTLPPYALQALHEVAVATDADVVLGRPASDFRGLNHSIYRRDIRGGTLAEHPELTETLTPHKMFRREFLARHHIRFPEGPVPLEDQMFVMRAYLWAKSISMLTDRPYYFYLRRIGSGRNAGDRPIDPVLQCAAVEQVLDEVQASKPEPGLRDRLFRRFYRINLLARLSEQAMIDYDDESRRVLIEEIRRVVTARFPAGVNTGAGAAHRTQGQLLLAVDMPALVSLAAEYLRIGVRAGADSLRWHHNALCLDIDGELQWAGEPLRCEPDGDGWLLPAALAPGVPAEDRRLDVERDEPDVELSLASRNTSAAFGIVEGLRLWVDVAGLVRLGGTVAIDPMTAMAGNPLADGLWDLVLRVRFAGWNRACAVRLTNPPDALALPFLDPDARTVSPFLTGSTGAIALDVGQWANSLAQQVAPTCAVASSGRDTLEFSATVVSAARTPPTVQLLLEPIGGTRGSVIECTGRLHPRPGGTIARLDVPGLARDGSWRAWLSFVGEHAATAPPVLLPWRIRQGRSTDRRRVGR